MKKIPDNLQKLQLKKWLSSIDKLLKIYNNHYVSSFLVNISIKDESESTSGNYFQRCDSRSDYYKFNLIFGIIESIAPKNLWKSAYFNVS